MTAEGWTRSTRLARSSCEPYHYLRHGRALCGVRIEAPGLLLAGRAVPPLVKRGRPVESFCGLCRAELAKAAA